MFHFDCLILTNASLRKNMLAILFLDLLHTLFEFFGLGLTEMHRGSGTIHLLIFKKLLTLQIFKIISQQSFLRFRGWYPFALGTKKLKLNGGGYMYGFMIVDSYHFWEWEKIHHTFQWRFWKFQFFSERTEFLHRGWFYTRFFLPKRGPYGSVEVEGVSMYPCTRFFL